jgi:hypothetical protein
MGFRPVPPASQKSVGGIPSGDPAPPRNCGKGGLRTWAGVTGAGWLIGERERRWKSDDIERQEDKGRF